MRGKYELIIIAWVPSITVFIKRSIYPFYYWAWDVKDSQIILVSSKYLTTKSMLNFTKNNMKDANSNTILSKDKDNKILNNWKSLQIFLYESNSNITCSFIDVDNKIAKFLESDINLSSLTYISVKSISTSQQRVVYSRKNANFN